MKGLVGGEIKILVRAVEIPLSQSRVHFHTSTFSNVDEVR
jgi:hypothetical protein